MKDLVLSYISPKNILIVVLCFFVWFFANSSCERKKEIVSYNNKISVLQDEVKTTKNKLGQYVSQRKSLELEYNDLNKLYFEKNSEVEELKKLVNKRTKSATIFSGQTRIDSFVETEIVYAPDSSLAYFSKFNDDWVSISTKSFIDTTFFDLTVRNKYHIKQENKREKWFGKRYLVTEITNLNPYSKTDSVLSYTQKQTQRKFGLDIQAGYGITGPYFGVGIGYRLISF